MKKLGLTVSLLMMGVASAAVPNNTLVYMKSADIATLDPGTTYDTSSAAVVENLYDTLVQYKGASIRELAPMLATGYKISNANKTYTFDLRKGVKFHSGNPFTCADAEYTFRRNLVTNTGDSGNWFLAESLLGTGSNAKDDKSITFAKIAAAVKCNSAGQLVFTLPKTDPSFLSKLAYTGQSIIDSKHAIKIGEWDGTEKTWMAHVGKDINNSPLSKNPSGTGAYQLVKRDNTVILAKAFPGYWGPKPAIENVVFQIVPELATRLEALKRGDADLVDTESRASLEQLKGAPNLVVVDDLPNTSQSVFFLNEDIKEPKLLGSGKLDGNGIPANFFKDQDVRRAFNFSFGYDQYIKEALQGKGVQRTMALPDSFPGYDENVKKYTFDPEMATTFFKRAHGGQLWDKGFRMTVNYRAGSVTSQTAAEILKKNIEALNPKFRIDVQEMPWSEILKQSRGGKVASVVLGWAPDYADPDNFIHTFYHSEGYYSPRLNFKDANIDAWVEQARSTTDAAKRNALYSLVGNKAYENPPFVLIPAGVDYFVKRDNLQGATKATSNPMLSFMTGTYWRELSKK